MYSEGYGNDSGQNHTSNSKEKRDGEKRHELN